MFSAQVFTLRQCNHCKRLEFQTNDIFNPKWKSVFDLQYNFERRDLQKALDKAQIKITIPLDPNAIF